LFVCKYGNRGKEAPGPGLVLDGPIDQLSVAGRRRDSPRARAGPPSSVHDHCSVRPAQSVPGTYRAFNHSELSITTPLPATSFPSTPSLLRIRIGIFGYTIYFLGGGEDVPPFIRGITPRSLPSAAKCTDKSI
jgi:hypothetical protein